MDNGTPTMCTPLRELSVIEVGAYDAKARLSALLNQVDQGETVVITRHGHPVAKLIPIGAGREDAREAVRELQRFRRGRLLGDMTLRQLREEGRR